MVGRLNSCKIVLKKILLGFLLHIILLFIYAVFLTYTNVPERTIPIVTALLGMICVFCISFLTAKAFKKNGLKNGAMMGMLYILIWYFVSSMISNSFSFSTRTVGTILLYILVGIFGGIVGVNMF